MRALVLGLLISVVAAGSASTAELTVTIDNVRDAKGDVRISVFASAKEWPDHPTPEHGQVLPAKTGNVVFKFDLPPGTYAIDGFHDELGTGKFKSSLIGLPEEGYLFSNNVRPGLSAPSFQSASFALPPEGKAISISIQYP